MNSVRVYGQLQDVCRSLDAAEDHAIAAYVEFAMSLIEEKYGAFSGDVDPAAPGTS